MKDRPVEEGGGEVRPPDERQRRHEGDNVEQVALEGDEAGEEDALKGRPEGGPVADVHGQLGN